MDALGRFLENNVKGNPYYVRIAKFLLWVLFLIGFFYSTLYGTYAANDIKEYDITGSINYAEHLVVFIINITVLIMYTVGILMNHEEVEESLGGMSEFIMLSLIAQNTLNKIAIIITHMEVVGKLYGKKPLIFIVVGLVILGILYNIMKGRAYELIHDNPEGRVKETH